MSNYITNEEINDLLNNESSLTESIDALLNDEGEDTVLIESIQAILGDEDGDTALMESIDAILNDEGEDTVLMESINAILGGEELEEKSVIKLDKQATMKKKLTNKAIEIAGKSGDPMAKKYKAIVKLEDELKGKLIKKYKAKAIQELKAGN